MLKVQVPLQAMRVVGAALALLFVAASCSASVTPPSPGGVDSEVTELQTGQADSATAGEVTGLLVKACMATKGYPNALESRQALPDESTEVPLSPSVVDAQKSGYGYTKSTFVRAVANAKVVPNTTDGYEDALFGNDTDVISVQLPDGLTTTIPSTGCYAQGRSAVYGDLKTYLRLTTIETGVRIAIKSPLESDADWLSATESWASCMRAGGYSEYKTPFDARNAVYRAYYKYYSGEPSAKLESIRENELGTSLADAQCAEKFQLKAVWKAGVAKSSQQFLSANAADIREWRSMVETAAKRGRALLGTK